MKTQKKSSDIAVGVIGYGGAFNMGRQHLLEVRAAGMRPAAVAEIDPKRLESAAADFPGIALFPSAAEMLKKSEVDLVIIITPHNTHAPLAIECLRAGRHVVCEKPLAISTAEADAMIRTAQKGGLMLSAYHNRHWDGHILQAVEIIRKKRLLGRIFRIDCRMGSYSRPGDWWRTSRSISGGILFDWGVHLLEYSLQLLDDPVREVSGFAHTGFWGPQTAWKDDANEDDAFAVVRFAGGQRLTLSISHLDPGEKAGWVTVTGELGSLTFGGIRTTLTTFRQGAEIITRLPERRSEYERYYRNVAAHLRRGEPLVITAEWARRPIHILDLAVRSARENRALPAKYG